MVSIPVLILLLVLAIINLLLIIVLFWYIAKVKGLNQIINSNKRELCDVSKELSDYKLKVLQRNNITELGVLENTTIDNDELTNMLLAILEENFKSKSFHKNFNNMMAILKDYYDVDYISIFTYKSDLDIVASNVNAELLPKLTKYVKSNTKSLNGLAGKITSSNDVLSYPTAGIRGIRFSAILPLTSDDTLIGLLLLENRDASEIDKTNNRFTLYTKVLKCTSLVLHNMLEIDDLVSMVSTDQLTGIYNRRYIDMTLLNQVDIFNSLGTSLGVVIFDIDHFKKFNDTYGHQFGDLVLKTLASFIKERLPNNSWVARYGGEEFVICFSKLDIDIIFSYIDKLREDISNMVLSSDNIEARITISLGLAMAEKGATVESLLKHADDALYQSKNNGRNKTTVYKY